MATVTQCDICGAILGTVKTVTRYDFPIPGVVVDGVGKEHFDDSRMMQVCPACTESNGQQIVTELVKRATYKEM